MQIKKLWSCFISMLSIQYILCLTSDNVCTQNNANRRNINISGQAENLPFYGTKNNCYIIHFDQSAVHTISIPYNSYAGNNGLAFTKIALNVYCYKFGKKAIYAFQRNSDSKGDGILLLQSSNNTINFLISDYSPSSAIVLKILNSKFQIFDSFTILISNGDPIERDISALLSLFKYYRNAGNIFLTSQVTNNLLGQLKLEANENVRNAFGISVLNEIKKIEITSRVHQLVLSSFIPMLSKISETFIYQKNMYEYCLKIFALHESTIEFYYFLLRENQIVCESVPRIRNTNLVRVRRDNATEEADNVETTTENEITAWKRTVRTYKELDAKSFKLASQLKSNSESLVQKELLIAKITCTSDQILTSWTYKEHIKLKLLKKSRFCQDILVSIMEVPETLYEEDKDISIPVYNIKVAYTMYIGKKLYWQTIEDESIDFRVERTLLPYYANVTYNVTMPHDKSKWTDEMMLQKMSVHRLDCFKQTYIYMTFLLNKGVKLKVITTISYRPDKYDLKEVDIIDSDNESSLRLELFEYLEENKWVYLGILPHEDMAQGGDGDLMVDYKLGISSRACMIFDEKIYHWVKICKPGEDDIHYLVCTCNHTSFITASADDVYNRVDAALTIKIDLPIASSNIIFYFVAGVILLYCIAICFEIIRTTNYKGKEHLLVVADNLKNDRYGYMVNIKTGNTGDAGTTSNITIQLKGSLAVSRKHVLNYPDPEKRLLDADSSHIYILATSKYLGDLIEVKLWFDSIGYRPTWFLRKLNIIDMQTKTKWSFIVYRWLDVTKQSHILILTAENCNNHRMNNNFLKNIHFYFGPKNLWNIFDRSYDIQFPFTTRLTIILSQILNTYAAALFFYGTPKLKNTDGFYMGEIQDPLLIIRLSFITSAISFNFNNGFAFVMRHTSKKFDENCINYKKNLFPYKAEMYIWVLLAISIFGSLIYLVFFGFWVPQVKAYMWLITSTFAICISIFIYESAFISLWHILLFILDREKKLTTEKIYNFDLIFQYIEKQRAYIHNKFGEYMLRPYLRHLYAPLDHSRLQAKKILEIKRTEVARLFKDMILFIIYIFVLYLFSFLNASKFVYRFNHKMELMVTQPYHQMGCGLKDINYYTDMYDYLENTLIPNIYRNHWYGNFVDTGEHDDGYMSDYGSKILGVILIRQFRRQKPDCELPNILKQLGIPCRLQGIVSTEHNHTNREPHQKGPMWELETPENSNLPSITGKLMIYPKGGFYVLLERTLKQSLVILHRMRKLQWIDVGTKALIIHFWTYNPNVNLFNLVQIVIEYSSSGYMESTYQITSSHLIFVSKYRQTLLLVFLILLTILMANRFVMGMSELLGDIRKFFKNIWNYVDVILLACTSIMIGESVLVQQKTSALLEDMNDANTGDFVNFMAIADYLQFSRILKAFTVCLATVRLWKSLRFGILFRIMEHTILSASVALFISFFYVFFIMFGFSCLAYATFGAFNDDITNLIETYIYIILKSLGNQVIDDSRGSLRFSNAGFGSALIHIFILSTLSLYTIITVIIIMHYEQSKDIFQRINAIYTVKEHIIAEYIYYKALIFRKCQELRLRGGGTISCLETVYPKRDTRYAKSIIMQQDIMDRMTIIARSFIRRQDRIENRFTKVDYSLMVDAVLKHFEVKKHKHQKVIFFHTRSGANDITLVSNERLLQIETFLRRILIHTRAAYESEDGENLNVEKVYHEKKIKAIGDAQKMESINRRLVILEQCVRKIEFVAVGSDILYI